MEVNELSFKQNMFHATKKDITGMVNLAKNAGVNSLYVTDSFYNRIFNKNPYIFRVQKHKGYINGMYSMYPLTKGIYEGVLKNTVQEEEIPNFIAPFQSKEIFVYLGPVIVNPRFEGKTDVSSNLILDLRKKLVALSKQNIIVKELGTIAREEDAQILSRLGFKSIGTLNKKGGMYTIYTANILDVVLSDKVWTV